MMSSRMSWRAGDAMRTLRGERGVVAARGADLQRADGAEAAGLAAGVALGAAQTVAVFDFLHSWETGASRTPHPVAAGAELEPLRQLARCHRLAAYAGTLLRSTLYQNQGFSSKAARRRPFPPPCPEFRDTTSPPCRADKLIHLVLHATHLNSTVRFSSYGRITYAKRAADSAALLLHSPLPTLQST